MTSKRKRPTQADVARLAGVSQSTVSMVLNQRDGGAILISEDTVRKVSEAIQALGYAPDPVAQMLAQGRNQLLGVFSYDAAYYLHENLYHKFLVGIENGADAYDYNILLFTRNRKQPNRRIFQNGGNPLRLVDGAILMGYYPDPDELRQLASERYPFVYIGRRDVPDADFDWVSSDYREAGVQATRHLIDLNHRRLGYLCHLSNFQLNSLQERWAGCQSVIAGAPDATITLLDQEAIDSPEMFARLIREHGLTAIICNDAVNFGKTMQFLAHLPLRVPQDLSVLALGDTNDGTTITSQVTHVRLKQEQVGEAAVSALIARIEGVTPSAAQHIYIPCEFVIGETTTHYNRP